MFMNAIYKNQSALKIRVVCSKLIDGVLTPLDITGALETKIKYKKPSGATGSWTAIIENAAQGIIYYDVTTTEVIDESGTWKIWPFIKFSDARVAPGTPEEIMVLVEGEAV